MMKSISVISNLMWKFGERISAQFVTLFVSIVLARLLSPSDYGAIALVTIFITIANVFVVNGFGTALIQKKQADNLDFSSVFYVNILFSLFLYAILFILSPYVASFYNMEILCPVMRVLSLRIPIAAINSIQQAYVSRNMMFKKFFFSTLFGTLLSGIVGCVMAYKGFGIWALVGQYLTNTTVDTIVLWFTVRWRPELKFSFSRVKVLLSYGWKLLLSGLLDTGYQQLRSLIIGKKYTSSDLAYYNQGQKYPELVVVNINTSISSVLFPAISQSQDNIEVVKGMTRRAIKVSSFIMWPLMVPLIIIASPLISIMLTDKWLECVPYLQIACFTYGFWPIHTANLEALKAIGRSDLFLKLEIAKKVIGITVLLISMNFGVLAIALSGILTTITSCFINAYPNTKILKYRYFEQFIDILSNMIVAILMGVLIYPIKFLISNKFLLILVQILLGMLIYIFLSRIFKLDSFYYIINLMKNKFKGSGSNE